MIWIGFPKASHILNSLTLLPHIHTHTCMHACMHTHTTHTYTHTHTHTHTHKYTHIHIHVNAQQAITKILQTMITQEERVLVFSNVKEVRLVDQPIVYGSCAEQFAVALQPACVFISISPMISSATENQNTIYIAIYIYIHM